ncbi:MAG TPA: hypothetical protein VFR74_13000 [Jiangellales bacterium]|nr:hypothetical protein [Jiangellales bacterium]
MAAFTVWKFDTSDGASHAAGILKQAATDHLVKVVDHAVVSWPAGAARPTTAHSHDDVRRGTGWGALWGLLAGAPFLVPVVGGVVGAAIGVLFVVTEEGDLDRGGERFHGMPWKLITTNLTDAERRVLHETFGG